MENKTNQKEEEEQEKEAIEKGMKVNILL